MLYLCEIVVRFCLRRDRPGHPPTPSLKSNIAFAIVTPSLTVVASNTRRGHVQSVSSVHVRLPSGPTYGARLRASKKRLVVLGVLPHALLPICTRDGGQVLLSDRNGGAVRLSSGKLLSAWDAEGGSVQVPDRNVREYDEPRRRHRVQRLRGRYVFR